MEGHQPHPVTPISADAIHIKHGKKRGGYNCGRCGQPKRGHKCPLPTSSTTSIFTPIDSSTSSTLRPSILRRALSFDENDDANSSLGAIDPELEAEFVDGRSGKLTPSCLWEVLKRLPPVDLMTAASVCKGWSHVVRLLWRSTEELRFIVPAKSEKGLVESVLQNCTSLLKLSLKMQSDVDSTILTCIACSCPNLNFMEILTSDTSINRITGDELSNFVAEIRCLSNLKIQGCSNLGYLVLSSTTLSTIYLSDLFNLSKIVFNCPNLTDISLDFSYQKNDSTDLITMVNNLGKNTPLLQNLHIGSFHLSHAFVLALTAIELRELQKLSLVLGSEINDASVAAITSTYSNLQLLDLSGSSISDSGIGMICNVYADTLLELLIALCPNITSSGIQFATAQLPYLELMDCGMNICESEKSHLLQKLIIKHNRLEKLSLWGCSGLDSLFLNCPLLNDLNLNSCTNLNPGRLLLQCPNLKTVHATGCEDTLVKTIKSQVWSDLLDIESIFPSKLVPDGSKRIRVPHSYSPQPQDNGRKRRRIVKVPCTVVVK